MTSFTPTFHSFHTDILYKFLSPIEWLSLSRVNKWFHKTCNPSKTFYPLFMAHFKKLLIQFYGPDLELLKRKKTLFMENTNPRSSRIEEWSEQSKEVYKHVENFVIEHDAEKIQSKKVKRAKNIVSGQSIEKKRSKVFDDEQFLNNFLYLLHKSGGVLAGGFILAVLRGVSSFGDVDVFFCNNHEISYMELYMRPLLKFAVDLSGGYRYDIPYIKNVTQYNTHKRKKTQFIYFDHEFYNPENTKKKTEFTCDDDGSDDEGKSIGEQHKLVYESVCRRSGGKPYMTLEDIIHYNFDLDICLSTFDGKTLNIPHFNAIASGNATIYFMPYAETQHKIPVPHDYHERRKYLYVAKKRMGRANKYKSRGFNVCGVEVIEQFIKDCEKYDADIATFANLPRHFVCSIIYYTGNHPETFRLCEDLRFIKELRPKMRFLIALYADYKVCLDQFVPPPDDSEPTKLTRELVIDRAFEYYTSIIPTFRFKRDRFPSVYLKRYVNTFLTTEERKNMGFNYVE